MVEPGNLSGQETPFTAQQSAELRDLLAAEESIEPLPHDPQPVEATAAGQEGRHRKFRSSHEVIDAHMQGWQVMPGPEVQARAEEYQESGCVVSTAEVAFGAFATDEEIDERLSGIRAHEDRVDAERMNWIRAYSGDPDDALRASIAYFQEDARQQTLHFYEGLRSHDSPLGNALRPYSVARGELTAVEILQRLRSGEIIFMENAPDHLVQIGYYPPTQHDPEFFGNFTDSSSVSDLYDDPDGPFHCYVFARADSQALTNRRK